MGIMALPGLQFPDAGCSDFRQDNYGPVEVVIRGKGSS